MMFQRDSGAARLKKLRKNSGKQIPRGLKPARNDKEEGLGRGAEAPLNPPRLFPQAVKVAWFQTPRDTESPSRAGQESGPIDVGAPCRKGQLCASVRRLLMANKANSSRLLTPTLSKMLVR